MLPSGFLSCFWRQIAINAMAASAKAMPVTWPRVARSLSNHAASNMVPAG